MKPRCVSCKRCLCCKCHLDGTCEQIDRSRRIFLLGALVAPVAPKLLIPAPAVAAIDTETTGRIVVNGQEWKFAGANNMIATVMVSGFGAAYVWKRGFNGDVEVQRIPGEL
jgi:hypothetical protein